MSKSKRVVVCLAIDAQDNVLMGQRNDNDKWCCPAGKLYAKEDPYVGAMREFKEETGVEPQDLKLIGSEWNKDKNIILYLFAIYISPLAVFDPSMDPDKEFKHLKYVNPNDVAENCSVPLEDNIALKYWMNN